MKDKRLSEAFCGGFILSCFAEKKDSPLSWWWLLAIIAFIVVTVFSMISMSYAFETEASYFTRASCLREGTSGIMANGMPLVDFNLICASWDYKFGTLLRVTNVSNGKSVVVKVSDRGPARRLYRAGRKLDLSYEAMRRLDGIRRGLIQVQVIEVAT
jgi:rare lipoprotein A (peptidoglycan hydrolase)